MADVLNLRPLVWLGGSRKDFSSFPEAVKDRMGYALYVAQRGGKHVDAKALAGYGDAGVVEIVSSFRSDTFRAVYTVRVAGIIYVLHVFQKKSKTGRQTPKADIDLIDARLREAERIAKENRQ